MLPKQKMSYPAVILKESSQKKASDLFINKRNNFLKSI